MKYAGLKENDVVNGEGICVSFFVQGCPHRCPGCFNPETWDFNGGLELPEDYKQKIYNALTTNGVKRNFSILGGEPLCEENKMLTYEIISYVRNWLPNIKIYLWSGYRFDQLKDKNDPIIESILEQIDYLIDGKFQKELKDFSLKLFSMMIPFLK